MAEARVEVETSAQARQLQDLCAERCSMPYRAPELFNVQVGDRLDERTDIWVSCRLDWAGQSACWSFCHEPGPSK